MKKLKLQWPKIFHFNFQGNANQATLRPGYDSTGMATVKKNDDKQQTKKQTSPDITKYWRGYGNEALLLCCRSMN